MMQQTESRFNAHARAKRRAESGVLTFETMLSAAEKAAESLK